MKIAILGGGVSGLSCAHYLSKLSNALGRTDKIVLFEASHQVGGWLKSHRFDDGVIHELGPKSLRASGTPAFNTLLLAEELNLTPEIINVKHGDPAASKRLIAIDDQLYTLPNNLKSLFFRTPPFSRPLIRALFKDLRTPKLSLPVDQEDVTVDDFMRARFGEEVAKYLADPMCRGIAAGDSRKLSIRSIFPPVFKGEREKGSVIRGMFSPDPIPMPLSEEFRKSALVSRVRTEKWSIWSLKSGLQQLPDKLLRDLQSRPNTEIHLGSQVEHIMFKDDGTSVLHVFRRNSTRPVSVDHIFSALPACHLARNISSKVYPDLQTTLESIRFANVVVVNLEYPGAVIPRDMGFGFLTPSFTGSPVLGIVFDSCCFPDHDNHRDVTRLTVMMGGDWFEDHFGEPDDVDHSQMLGLLVFVFGFIIVNAILLMVSPYLFNKVTRPTMLTCLKPKYDHDLLSLRWTPTYCVTRKCLNPSNEWEIHGLWPNYNKTRGPLNCCPTWQFNSANLTSILPDLKEDWPNQEIDKGENSLWQHEWVKHGTCSYVARSGQGMFDYFNTTLALYKQFPIGKWLADAGITPAPIEKNISYSLKEVRKAIEDQAGKVISLKCATRKDGLPLLDTIYLCFRPQNQTPIDCPSGGEQRLCKGGKVLIPSVVTN